MIVSRTLRAFAVVGIALAAACSDSRSATGPGTLVDPAATAGALASFDSAFASAAVVSFTSLSGAVQPTAALARAGIVLGATRPAEVTRGTGPAAAAVQRLSGLRVLAASALNPQGALIPDTLYGSIYTWDSASAGYTRSQTSGGPANGVRFTLYAIDPLTGTVSFPLTPVGRLDLLDESSGPTSVQLHVLVQGTGGTPTYIDYTTTLSLGLGTLTATATGSVSNALQPPANKTLTFRVTASFTLESVTVDATYTLNNPAFTIALNAIDVRTLVTDSVDVDLLVVRPNEAVRFTGVLKTTSNVVDTVFAQITVNAQLYASVKGNAAGVTFYDRNNVPIQDVGAQHDILVALDYLSDVAEGVLVFTAALFEPIINLLSL
jgi:hypothetical protein